jgi:hypothetical protein
MQQSVFRRREFRIHRVKSVVSVLAIGALAFFQPACSTLTSSQKGALLVAYYGGPAAGELASAGLSALGSVLQGYVGNTVPTSVVQASPGVANVGVAVAGVIAPNHTVSQSDVNTVNQAAALIRMKVEG